MVGPWDHGLSSVFAGRQFGRSATAVSQQLPALHLRFFDRLLRGREDAEEIPRVRLFVMGADYWLNSSAWPLPETCHVEYFLDGAGGANTCFR